MTVKINVEILRKAFRFLLHEYFQNIYFNSLSICYFNYYKANDQH